jgi:hypothetical protein
MQRRPVAKPLTVYEAAGKGYRDTATAAAFRSGDFTMKQLAEYF